MKNLLIVSAALMVLAAGPAHADPISAVASVFIKMGVGAFAAVHLAQIGLGLGLNLLSTAIQKKMMGGQQQRIDVKFDVEMGDDKPLSFVVGDYVTAGKRKYIGSWGRNWRFVVEVIEVSVMPQGLAGLWVDDQPGDFVTGREGAISDAWNGDKVLEVAAGAVPAGYVSLGTPLNNHRDDKDTSDPRIWVKWVDGAQTAADPYLLAYGVNDEDYPWSADMIGTGKSYAIVTTQYDSDTLTKYPQYLWQPAPLPMYDPRYDSTAGGSGPHRWGNRATYAASRNPAVISYNIARGIYLGDEWIFGGRNLSAWRLPVAEWMAAMNACDDTVALAEGGSEPAYRCGAEISVDMEPLGVLEELGRAANMRFAEVGGRLKPLVDLPGASVFSITDGDITITEGQSLRPFAPVSETFNALGATYPEPAEKWVNKDAPEYVDAEGMASDGGRYLPTSVSYPAAPYANQVQRLMRAQMREYRRDIIIQLVLPPDAYALEPLDMLTWDSDRNGYVGKRFLIEQIGKLPGMGVSVTMREVDPGDYDWHSDFQLPVTVTPPAPPQLWAQDISDFAAHGDAVLDTAGAARVAAVVVTCGGGRPAITGLRVQIRRVGQVNPDLDLLLPYGAPWRWPITGVAPLTTYQVRGALLSSLTGLYDWSDWLTVETPDIRLGLNGLEQDIRGWLAEMDRWLTAGVNAPVDILNLAGSLRAYSDELRALTGALAEGQVRRLLAEQQIRDYVARAETTLGARIDLTDGQVSIVAMAVTELQAKIPGLATTDVLDALVARVTQSEGRITAQGEAITGIVSTLPGLASADALSSLTTRVEDTESGLTSLGNAVTSISNQLPGLASATALNALTTRVTNTEGSVTSLGDALTSLSASVGKFSASGLLRTTVEATPSGALSRIGLYASATNGEADGARVAALYLDAIAGGLSRITLRADRVAVTDGSGMVAPFVIDGGQVFMNVAMIRDLTADHLKAGTITADRIVANGITRQGVAGSGPAIIGNPSPTAWVTVCQFTLAAMPVSSYVQGQCNIRFTSDFSAYPDPVPGVRNGFEVQVLVNGVVRAAYTKFELIASYGTGSNRTIFFPFTATSVPAGDVTVALRISDTGDNATGIRNSNLTAIAAMR